MQFIYNSLYILVTFSYINMAVLTENRTLSTSESSSEVDVHTILKSMTIPKAVDENNTSGSITNENIYRTENPVRDFIENGSLTNVTTTEFDNSTDENDSEIDSIHSSFNLAIIPAAAVFVFIVITCFKCCKWFRQYTRGGNKDENFYAVIVTDDDKEYGHIDITSESASTTCYDTISSYASFLKRSGNESSLSSIRAWRQESLKKESASTPGQRDVGKTSGCEPDTNSFISLRSTKRKVDEITGDFDVRISSTSSAETVSEQLNDSPVIRRNNRFRVSFVNAEKPTASEYRMPNGNVKHEKVMRSSLKKSPTATSPGSTSPGKASGKPSEAIKMVDVGTQTNKSFRYSLRKTKGHVSDSDLDERYFSRIPTGTMALPEAHRQRKNDDIKKLTENNGERKASKHVKHSSISSDDVIKSSRSSAIPEISKYPLDTNVEVIHNSKQTKEPDDDLDDDVFIEEMGTADSGNIITIDLNKSPEISNSNLNKSPETCNSNSKKSEEISNSSLNKLPETCYSSLNEVPEICNSNFNKPLEISNSNLTNVQEISNSNWTNVQEISNSNLTNMQEISNSNLNKVPQICNSSKIESGDKLFVGLTHPETHSCSQCKSKIHRNDVKPISDECELQISARKSVIQKMCENCKVIYDHKQKESCETGINETDPLLIENECRFTLTNERPFSALSLESSGYAELSSSESASSSP